MRALIYELQVFVIKGCWGCGGMSVLSLGLRLCYGYGVWLGGMRVLSSDLRGGSGEWNVGDACPSGSKSFLNTCAKYLGVIYFEFTPNCPITFFECLA